MDPKAQPNLAGQASRLPAWRREGLTLMAELAQELAKIKHYIDTTEDTTATFEKLKRWKARAVRLLSEKISEAEGAALAAKEGPIILGNAYASATGEIDKYAGFIKALREQIKEHPEDVMDKQPTPEAPPSKTNHPRAFISYSWDSDPHKKWVADLGARLRADGIDTQLDQWHAVPGDQLPHFMECGIRDNDFVIIICTPKYKLKSNNRTGGVGYEGDIMTAEVLTTRNERKFIPVLAAGSWAEAAPSWLQAKYYVDLSDPAKLGQNYQDLFTTIAGIRTQPPPLGSPPKTSSPPPQASPSKQAKPEPIRILGVVVDQVTEPRMDGTVGCALYRVPFRLSRAPSIEWIQLFQQAWEAPPRFTTMHRPGIAHVDRDRIILDGTTIDEVQQYHKDTLQLCVNVANQKYADWLARIAEQRAQDQQRAEAHRKKIEDISSQIRFED